MRERKECHCMLFLVKENPYASPNQIIEESHFNEFSH
jgi:ferredoxin-thioredoxin reductase catalytic subunit